MVLEPPPVIHDAIATRSLIGFAPLMEALRRAMDEVTTGDIVCPERTVVAMSDGALLLSMPAVAKDIAIHKLITVAPGNARRGLPAIQGSVTALDPSTGRVLAVLDGPTVTGLRTAAVSMLAIVALASDRPVRVLVIGTGSQARFHVAALAVLHPEAKVRIRGTSLASARSFCDEAATTGHDLAVDDGSERHDVVITCTSSATPVHAEAARADCLVIAVGSFRPDRAEVARDTVVGSALYVDDLMGARHEAGDLIQAGVSWSAVTSLSDVLEGRSVRPPGPAFFKSVGCAAWDLAAARVAIKDPRRSGDGSHQQGQSQPPPPSDPPPRSTDPPPESQLSPP